MLAVMVALPGAMVVIRPPGVTLAMVGAELTQDTWSVTSLVFPSERTAMAVICSDRPAATEGVGGVNCKCVIVEVEGVGPPAPPHPSRDKKTKNTTNALIFCCFLY